MLRFYHILSLGVFLSSTTLLVHASGMEGQKTKALDPILVLGHDAVDEQYFTPQSSVYLTDSDITRFRGTSVGDFLQGIPGVLVGDNRNSGGVDINIRGMQGENRVPVVIDGSLQAIPIFRGYYGSATRTYLDPDLISDVRIEKGPSMAADAVGATGGVARMNTISAKDIIAEGRDWGVRITGGIMSNTILPPQKYTRGGYQTEFIKECKSIPSGATCEPYSYAPENRYASSWPHFKSFNGSIAVAKQWRNLDVLFAYAHRKQGNYFVGRHGRTPTVAKINIDPWGDRLFNGSEIEVGKVEFADRRGFTLYRAGEEALNTSQDNHSFLAKVGVRINPHHGLELGYRQYRSHFGEVMPSILGFRSEGARQGDENEMILHGYTANYYFAPPENHWLDLKANAWLTDTDSSFFNPLFEDYGYSDSRTALFLQSKKYGFGLENTSSFAAFNQPITVHYGVSYNKESIHPPVDAQDRVLAKGYPKNAIAPLYVRDGERKEWSAFLNTQYVFNQYLTLDAGVRYTNTTNIDHLPYKKLKGYRYDPIKKTYVLEFHPDQYAQPIKTSRFSPIIALTVSPNEHWQLYAKYAGGLRAPSLFQSSRGFSMSDLRPDAVSLHAERAKNWEVGTNIVMDNLISADDRFLMKLAYFDNKIDDYLTRTRVKVDPYSWVDQTANINTARFKGIELSLKYDADRYYGQLSGIYYTDTHFCVYPEQIDTNLNTGGSLCAKGGVASSNIGNHLPPKKSISATLGGRFLDRKLDLGTRITYHDKRLVSTVKREDNGYGLTSEYWDPYTIIDVYADYAFNENASINFAIDNLTDRYYLDAINVGLSPAPGRTVRLGFKYEF